MVTHTRLELVLPTWEAGVLTARRMGQKMVPRVGLEPTTPSLRVICSTNWANEANGAADGARTRDLRRDRAAF